MLAAAVAQLMLLFRSLRRRMPTRIEDWDEEVQDDNEQDGERGNSPEQRDDENQFDSGDDLYL